MQARTAVERSSMFRIGVSDITSKAPVRVRLHPLAARAEASRHGASLRLRGFPCLGPAMPGCFGSAMQSRFDRVVPLCERRNENAPGCWNPRAFAWPREIGVTDLRDAEGSVDGGGAEIIPLAAKLQCIAPFARAQARIALGRWQQCSDVEDGGHGNSMVRDSIENFAEGEGGAPYARFFRLATKFLHHRRAVGFLRSRGTRHPAHPFRCDARITRNDRRGLQPQKSPHRCGLFRRAGSLPAQG